MNSAKSQYTQLSHSRNHEYTIIPSGDKNIDDGKHKAVKIGSPGSNLSCFYFSISRGLISCINDPKLLKAEMEKIGMKVSDSYASNVNTMVQNFREGCSQWMVDTEGTKDKARNSIYYNDHIIKEILIGMTLCKDNIQLTLDTENKHINVVSHADLNSLRVQKIVSDSVSEFLFKIDGGMNIDDALTSMEVSFIPSNYEHIRSHGDITINNIMRYGDFSSNKSKFTDLIDKMVDTKLDVITSCINAVTGGININRFINTHPDIKKDMYFKDGANTIDILTSNDEVKKLILNGCSTARSYIFTIDKLFSEKNGEYNNVEISKIKLSTNIWKKRGNSIVLADQAYKQVATPLEKYIIARYNVLLFIRANVFSLNSDINYGPCELKDVKRVIDTRNGLYFAMTLVNPITDKLFTEEEAKDLMKSNLLECNLKRYSIATGDVLTDEQMRFSLYHQRKPFWELLGVLLDSDTGKRYDYDKIVNTMMKTEDEFREMITKFINPKTNIEYTRKEVDDIFNTDPRLQLRGRQREKLIASPELLELPLNANIFTAGSGIMIDKLNTLLNDGTKLSTFLSTIGGNGRVISDAGENDIISFTPYIFDVDLYIVKCTNVGIIPERVYIHGGSIPCRPSIVVNRTGGNNSGHFETVGVIHDIDKSVIKTCFEPNHPLILHIRKSLNM